MRLLIQLPALSALACLAATGLAWDDKVHNQIGFMADLLIKDVTRLVVRNVLEPEYNGSLGRAAGWADSVRRTTHKYSYGWHFISARGTPPDQCGLYYHRDCQEGGCLVQQISNQTNILEDCLVKQRDHKPSPGIQCSEALKWITHFIGEISQPLHTSGMLIGGNQFEVLFNGTKTNMHATWDENIIYALTSQPNGFPTTEIHPVFMKLLERMDSDSFRAPRSTWAMCDLDARHGTYCAERWAQDSNALLCDYVYGRYVNGSDLLTGPENYAQGALPIIEQQLAKAAWRLSSWLDALVDRVIVGGKAHQKPESRLFRVQRPGGSRSTYAHSSQDVDPELDL